MNILAINGSAKKNGTIDTALQSVLRYAAKNGHKIDIIDLKSLNLKNCQGCFACQKKGACIYRDDIEPVEKKIIDANLLVFGTPTHWGNMSGLMLSFFERLFGFFIQEQEKGVPKKRAANGKKVMIITACSTPFPFNIFFNQSRACISRLREICRYSGIKIVGTHCIADPFHNGIKKDLNTIEHKATRILKRIQ